MPFRLPGQVGRTRRREDYGQGVDGAFRFALFEVPCDPAPLIRHVRETQDSFVACVGECLEGGCLHLDRKQTLFFHSLNRVRRFAEGRVSRPGRSSLDRRAEAIKGAFDHVEKRCLGVAELGSGEIVVAGAFVS